jgi:hypothetical protein
MNDIVEKRGVEERRGIELFASDRCSDDGKDAGTNDGSNAERG